MAHGYVVKIKNPRAPDLIETWYAYISDPAEAMRAVFEAAHSTPDENIDIDGELTLEQLENLDLEPGQVRRPQHMLYEFSLPTKADKVSAGPDWNHEIKYDGNRMMVICDWDSVRLISRGGHDWARDFPLIVTER